MVLTGPLIRRRIAVSMAIFMVLFVVLTARLFALQVLDSEELQKRAQAQWTSQSVIAPSRGDITDRNGSVLAISATAYTASVNPRQVSDAKEFARALSPVLGIDEFALLEKASRTDRSSVILKRQLTREIAQQLKTMLAQHRAAGSDALNGLVLDEDRARYYPYGEFACQILGITTIDGVGQTGIESACNDYLTGKNGMVLTEIDGKGRSLSYGESEYVAAVDGSDVRLTIDVNIQGFCEKAAREAMEINSAEGVMIIVMDPRSGEILAMVNKPDYDLNNPPRENVELLTELMRNRLVSDAYEPGSTFKILTTAAALDAGVTNPSEGFYCSGSVKVEGGRVKCWGRPHGAESMAQGLENSCNPVFVELALRLGIDRFYGYLDAFGIGCETGVDIPGESAGIIISQSAVKRGDLARIGFGQSVAVTPLQLLTAACAAVNGGYLLKPYIVSEIISPDGEVLESGARTVISRPITEKTSETMRYLLTRVVENGGGKNARVAGYSVGGKTGTAQVYVNGAVSTDTHIGSFIGFAPMDDPRIAVLVIVDRADVAVDFGSVTAAPFAQSILAQSLAYLNCPMKSDAEKPVMTSVPGVEGMSLEDAVEALEDAGLSCVWSGEGGVAAQLPSAGASMAEGSLVMLYLTRASNDERLVCVPDVTGLSVAEANRLIRSYGLNMTISGGGVAVSQDPAPNTEVTPTSVVKVEFSPP